MTPASQLEVFQFTAIGDRKSNQDSMAHLLQPSYGLFVVADGLGGHQAGEKASEYFCKGLLNYAPVYVNLIHNNPVNAFLAWADVAVDEMRIMFDDDRLASMAHTTCAILYLDDNATLTAHCGDSRIYRINTTDVLWRTKDHSVPQMLCDMGEITEMEMAQHPEQNQLTRSININKKHRVEVSAYPPMTEQESFLLCTDGFWEYVKEDELVSLANSTTASSDLERLARLTTYRANGRGDNLTVMLVRAKRQR